MLPDSCKENQDEVSLRQAGALYLHVPFCLSKCRYCDFYSVLFDRELGRRFVQAAAAELSANTDCLDVPLASVFVGGGTPTALGGELLGELLSAVKGLIDEKTEFTVEANPGTINQGLAEVLVANGVNRLSVGVQSFHTQELRLLGRTHSPAQARQAVALGRRAGVKNISLDLIYAVPNQTLASWKSSLAQALGLGTEHLSCYALSLEPGTPLGQESLAGRLGEMDESLQKACYFAAVAATRRAGLGHYEISNFARPGAECMANLTYWRNEPYLGIGPAATSYIAGVRRTNRPELKSYISAISRGARPPATSEQLTGPKHMAETVILSLRLTQGVDRAAFTGRFGLDAADAFPQSIARYADLGAIVITPSHIRLSEGFLFVSDTIFADILAEAG